MIALTRRGAVIAAAAGGALLPFAAAWRTAGARRFVYDARLDSAGSVLAAARAAEMDVVPVVGDAGRLAHGMEAGLAGTAGGLFGLTMPAVTFIFEQLALRGGTRMVRHPPYLWEIEPGQRPRADPARPGLPGRAR